MRKSLDFLGLSHYFVVDDGTIWRCSYTGGNGIYYRQMQLKPAVDARGYLSSRLVDDNGEVHLYKTHRLLAAAFLRQLDPDQSVVMLNGDKTDIRPENLRILSADILKSALRDLHVPRKTRETLKSPGLQYHISEQAFDALDSISGGFGRRGSHKGSQTVRQLIKQAKEYGWRPAGEKRQLARTVVLTLPRELIAWLKSFRKGHGPLRDQVLDFLLVQFVAELQKQEEER